MLKVKGSGLYELSKLKGNFNFNIFNWDKSFLQYNYRKCKHYDKLIDIL